MILFLSQAAIIDVNPEFGQNLTVNCQSGLLGVIGDCETLGLDQDPKDSLPGGGNAVQEDTNFFTDIFSSIKNWILDITPVSYVLDILKAPMNLLKAMKAPDVVSFALGTAWYGLNLFLVIAFIWGRQGE